MHQTMRRVQHGDMIYYTCEALAPVRHAFTTKCGGVSQGDCAGLNLGFTRGDCNEHVLQNYQIMAQALHIPYQNITMTHQVHEDTVQVVDAHTAGTGLVHPMQWDADALITACAQVPLVGYYADCVVALFYDLHTHTCGVCHAGWRGTSIDIMGKTVHAMQQQFHANAHDIIAVLGPSICGECFETDADVPAAMRATMGSIVEPFITTRGEKYHMDLRQINAMLLQRAGLTQEHIIDSGICTCCQSDVFWSHRATNGKRGVQGAMICLTDSTMGENK